MVCSAVLRVSLTILQSILGFFNFVLTPQHIKVLKHRIVNGVLVKFQKPLKLFYIEKLPFRLNITFPGANQIK